jgi:hypothetical protein
MAHQMLLGTLRTNVLINPTCVTGGRAALPRSSARSASAFTCTPQKTFICSITKQSFPYSWK